MASLKPLAALTLAFATSIYAGKRVSSYVGDLSAARDAADKMLVDTSESTLNLYQQARANVPYMALEERVAPARRAFAEQIGEKYDLCDFDRIQLADELGGYNAEKLRRDTADTQLACAFD